MPLTKIDDRGLTTPIDLLDNEKIRVGTGNDLEISHDGTYNVIESNNGEIRLMNGSEYMFRAIPNGANRLYFANSTKAQTTSTGFMVNGHFDLVDSDQIRLGSSQDFKIYHDGTNSITFFDAQVGAVRFRTDIGNSARSNIILGNGVDLYYNNVKKFETTSSGVQVTGDVSHLAGTYTNASGGSIRCQHDSGKITVGAGNDLEIYHDGSNSFLKNNTGDLYLDSNSSGSIHFTQGGTGEVMASMNANGAVLLRHNNNIKFETTSGGAKVTGVLTSSITSGQAMSLADNAEIQLGTGDDLRIFHNGTKSIIDNNTGDLSIETTANEVHSVQSQFQVKMKGGDEDGLKVITDGAVELYYNNVKKFETSSTGNLSTGVHKFITGSGSTASDDNVLHIVAGSTSDRGVMIGTGRSTGSSQNDGMGFIDAINSESGGYGSQLQLRVDGNKVMVIGYQGNNRVGINELYPTARLHVTDDSTAEGIKTVHSNGTAGIGIGYNTILPVGSNANNQLNIRSKGNAHLRLGANSNDVLGIETDSRDVRFFTNAQGWSTQHFNMGGNYDMRVHRRRLNNGQNSVSTHNLFRLRRANWGWGHFEVRIYQTYYSGSYLRRARIVGHGQGGDHYSVRTMNDTWTNGGTAYWSAGVQTTTASSSSPGDSSVYFTDVQATLPNYTYAVCELIMISGYQTNNANDGASLATNSYTLWTP